MKKLNLQATLIISLERLIAMISRLTIGNTVCFTDMAFSLTMFFMPKTATFYGVGIIFSLAILFIVSLFQQNKLTSDLMDLCLYDSLVWIGAFICYQNKIDPSFAWYPLFVIPMLKLIRAYAKFESTTSKYGWAVFGPFTYFYMKKTESKFVWRAAIKNYIALILATATAIFLAIQDKQLSDEKRFIVALAVPIFFTLMDSRKLLRAVSFYTQQLLASVNQIAEKDAKIATLTQELAAQKNENGELKKENDTLRQLHALPKKAHTDLIEAYETTKPARQGHLVKIAQNIAAVFSIKRDS